MAFTIEERDTSRAITTGDNPAVELSFSMLGSGTDPLIDDDQEALIALEAVAPLEFLGLPRRSVRVEPVALGIWNGEASYAPAPESEAPTPSDIGQTVISFDTGGGTQHITQNMLTRGVFVAQGVTPPALNGAIGVTADSVEGTDIIAPSLQFTIAAKLPDSTVTDAYKRTLALVTGTVNADVFRGHQPGEVLFLGVAGGQMGVEGSGAPWDLTFRFAVSFNRDDFIVGGITITTKLGWDYLWAFQQSMEDAPSQAIVKRTTTVYTEKVYHATAFIILGI